jgi:hypothetical protein
MSNIKGDKPTLPPGGPQTAAEQTQAAEKVSTQQGGLPIKGEPGQQGQPPLTTDQLAGNKKLSAADAERLVSQAGYQRSAGRKRDKNFDVGDSQGAPIPLPVDDVDESQWEGRSLDDAQEDLTLQGATLAQVAEELADIEDPAALWKKLLELTYKPTEEDVGKLQRLEPEPTRPLDLRTVYASAGAHFGVRLDGVAPGPTLVAAALLVAGVRDAVKPEGKGLAPQALARGVFRVVQSGNKAVGDAKAMNQGISKNLSMHRTFVFKR